MYIRLNDSKIIENENLCQFITSSHNVQNIYVLTMFLFSREHCLLTNGGSKVGNNEKYIFVFTDGGFNHNIETEKTIQLRLGDHIKNKKS